MSLVIDFNGKTYRPKSIVPNGTAYGDSTNDWFEALDGDNTIYAGKGRNVVLAGVTFEQVLGSIPLQSLLVTPIANAGNNIVYTGSGNDYVVTGSGNDKVYLGKGNNTYDGLAGGSDDIYAESGNDRISVKVTGITNIFAGKGRNIIDAIGDVGTLNIYTGSGNDVVNLNLGAVQFNVDLGEGNNRATISASSSYSSFEASSTVKAGRGNDVISINHTGQLKLDAGDGRNMIDISNGSGWVKTGSGADVIKVRKGKTVVIDSGDGNDDISGYSDSYPIYVNAGEGNNLINIFNRNGGGGGATAGSGNDLIVVVASRSVEIDAGDGNNQIVFRSYRSPRPGVDVVNSGSGNDVIYNLGESTVQINVGEGNNYISVSSSYAVNTTITAGKGWDTFNLESNGRARITYFNSGDKIILADTAGVRVVNGSNAGEVEVYKGETLRAIVENSTVGLVTRSVSAGSSRSYSPTLKEMLTANSLMVASDLQV